MPKPEAETAHEVVAEEPTYQINLQIPTRSLISKLAGIMKEIDHVEKRGRNTFQNYNYVKAGDLAHLVRDKLAKRHIIMLSDVVDVRSYEIPAKEGVMQATDLRINYTFYDGESGETVSCHGYGSGADKGDKAAYKAHTGALKYILRNTFLVPDESDPGSDPESDERTDKETQTAGKPNTVKAPAKVNPAPATVGAQKPAASSQNELTPVQRAEVNKIVDVAQESEGRVPTPEELVAFLKRCKAITKELATAKMEPSVGEKFKKFLLAESGAADLNNISVDKYNKILSNMEGLIKSDVKKAIEQIEARIK